MSKILNSPSVPFVNLSLKKPLAEISFGHVLLNLFNTARRFNMEVQPQLVLLQKTLLYVEGLGRQLYPQLDLWTTAKPFLESWLRDQVGLPAVIRALKEKAPFWAEKFPELPELVYDSLQQHKLLQQSVEKLTIQIQGQQQRQGQSRYLFGVGATLLVSGTILFLADATEVSTGFIVAGALAWFIGWRRTC